MSAKAFVPTPSDVTVRVIWDRDRIPDRDTGRIEFPALIRFKGYWYSAFREAEIHNNHPSGRARLIRSADGETWETVRLFDWGCGDVREPKFSITAEGNLMINTSVYFVTREPSMYVDRRTDTVSYTPPEAMKKPEEHAVYHQLPYRGTCLNLPDNDEEREATQQTVTWLSSDGVNWSSAYACPTGLNTWRWDCTWYRGMGYGVSQWGKDPKGVLYRTRDGKSWRVLKEDFAPEGKCNEGAIAFGTDHTAYCLLRHSTQNVMLGVGQAPYYQDWEWRELQVDYGDGPGPASEVFGVSVGGPVLETLSDGRLVAAGRALGPGRDDGHATVFWLDPEQNLLTLFAELDGTTYPGVVEHDGQLWVSYVGSGCHDDIWEVHLASMDIPAR